MVNVVIHQFQPGGAVVDAAALAQFQEQWATYRKLVESDYLSHIEVGRILQETLNLAGAPGLRTVEVVGQRTAPDELLAHLEWAVQRPAYRAPTAG